MKKQKMSYESPEVTVTHVELESAICAGSVDFGIQDKRIEIESQGVADVTNNDFSDKEWIVDETKTQPTN